MRQDILSAFDNFEKPKDLPLGFIDPGCGEKEELKSLLSKNVDELDKWTLIDAGTAWTYFDEDYVNYYISGIISFSTENPTQNFQILEDILSEISREYDVNGLTSNFRAKWKGLSKRQLVILNEWLQSLSSYYVNYNFSQIESVICRLQSEK